MATVPAQRRGPIDRRVAAAPEGTWYVNANHYRLTITIAAAATGFTGALQSADGPAEQLEHITWDAARAELSFRRNLAPAYQWYRVTLADGLMTGRYSHLANPDLPADAFAWVWRVTGWEAGLVSRLAPRVYEISANGYLARLRIDRDSARDPPFTGRIRFFASATAGFEPESELEYPEEDIEIPVWDGARIEFRRGGQLYTGAVNGRRISGAFTDNGLAYAWAGTQVEVLGRGFAPADTAERLAWQTRARRQLARLIMAGNPTARAIRLALRQDDVPPRFPPIWPWERDDNPAAWPPNYRLTRFDLEMDIPVSVGGGAVTRTVTAWLAIPGTAVFASGKFPLVIALNGHGGSAWEIFNPVNDFFWFGDGFARRGYAVLAVDIAHRPPEDRIYYRGETPAETLGYPDNGIDDIEDAWGHRPQPSIKPAASDIPGAALAAGYQRLYTDWEETGERAWTVMRALDWTLDQPEFNLDPDRVLVTGLSLGGEIAAWVAAMDTRVSMAVVAGFSPDPGVLKYRGSHGCWNWAYADMREYMDTADLFALIAPRPLIIQTGKLDDTYSGYSLLGRELARELLLDMSEPALRLYAGNFRPFAGDKQIARRVRAAYADAPANFVHNLHYDWHTWQAGDLNPTFGFGGSNENAWKPGVREALVRPSQKGLTVPAQTGPEHGPGWQTDKTTVTDGRTVFDRVDEYLQLIRIGGKENRADTPAGTVR
ncbi:MAG: hypothetical protein ACKV2V_24850 [Blastocatellia bacterium]